MNQVATDWTLKPFVKMAVTNDTACPPDTPDIVFFRKWHGTDVGCDCLGIWSGDIPYDNTMIPSRGCTYNETREGCYNA
jgi:hypothetical protein